MDQSITSRAAVRQRGADAFNAGKPRDSHNMNWHADALGDWLFGYDQAAQAWHRALRQQAEVVLDEVAEQ